MFSMLVQAALSQAGQEVEAARASSFSLEREVESLRNTVADLQASQVGSTARVQPQRAAHGCTYDFFNAIVSS
jgi:hypothetical protein